MNKEKWEEARPEVCAVIESAIEKYRTVGRVMLDDAQRLADLLDMKIQLKQSDNALHFCCMVQLRISQLQITHG